MNKIYSNKLKISIILNILIVVLDIFAFIVMFTDWNLFNTTEVLVLNDFKALQFYTVDSNLLMGIIALLTLIIEILYLTKKIKSLKKIFFLFKLIGTVGVTITFLITAFFLGPTSESGYLSLFTNSNFFFHLIIPLLSMIDFMFFFKTNELKITDAVIGESSLFVYSIYYMINVFAHAENGTVSSFYDFYGFLFGKVINAVFVIPIIFIFGFIISFLLYKINKTFKKA